MSALKELHLALDAYVDPEDQSQKDAVVAAAKALRITDYGNVSNAMARKILAARGEEVKFKEKTIVNSDYNMRSLGENTYG